MKNKCNHTIITLLLLSLFIAPTQASPHKANILIFISLSMPEQSLLSWLEQAKRANARVVIRGLYKDSLYKTIQSIKKLSEKTQMGVDIDPIIFQKLEIEKVPAVVVLKNNEELENSSPEFDVVYGNVTLSHALKIIAYGGAVASETATLALNNLMRKTDE